MNGGLVRVICRSRRLDVCGRVQDARAILANASLTNARAGVSGLLIHADDWFLQALEGPRPAVERTMSIIRADRRNDRVEVVADGPIEARRFQSWSMAAADVGADEAIVAARLGLATPIDPFGLDGEKLMLVLDAYAGFDEDLIDDIAVA